MSIRHQSAIHPDREPNGFKPPEHRHKAATDAPSAFDLRFAKVAGHPAHEPPPPLSQVQKIKREIGKSLRRARFYFLVIFALALILHFGFSHPPKGEQCVTVGPMKECG